MIGARRNGLASLRAAADTRIRAFTLLTLTYDQARRAVIYLRWEQGDVQRIAPSLYTGRGGRKRVENASALASAKAPSVALAVLER